MRFVLASVLLSSTILVACPESNVTPTEGEGEGEGGEGEGENPGGEGEGENPVGEGEGEPAAGLGGACSCDTDCPTVEGHAGLCVAGICFAEPSDDCSGDGSTAECPTGTRCWPIQEGFPLCWADCVGGGDTCDGACDEDNSCVPTSASNAACDGTCAAGCFGGGNQTDPTPVALPPVPAPSTANCDDIPGFECVHPNANATAAQIEEYCGELVFFDPRQGDGYDDYLINGETANDQYRSWIRRDVMLLVKYATAHTRCAAADWDFGNDTLGLGDMSQEDGEIPGTRENDPGHPPECHERGYDMDIAYYQLGQTDNRLRPVCPFTVDGADQHHCLAAPTILDTYRTVVFIAHLMDSPQYLTVGVDGKVAPVLQATAAQLCANGVLDPASKACGNRGIERGGRNQMGSGLSYDPTEPGVGWFPFHHHHLHLSVYDTQFGYLPNW